VPQDDLTAPFTIGEVIAGKYRLERVLGRGGMGVVVLAIHMELDQRVALKFLTKEAAARPEIVARFAREAKAAAKIHSEHVARVFDVGTLPAGTPYVVMEFMDGEDLASVLSRRGPLPVQLAIGYVLEACEAIAEAHALGIVHRDLKPANIFLARRPAGWPIVKVLDFGISKSTFATAQAQLTKTSALMGSPLYMSPEQLMAVKTVDVRSDIWSLGVVLYELVSARMPFEGETLPEVIAAVLHRGHDPLRTVRPDVPPALEAVVDRCLAKDVAARFDNVGEFAVALAPFGQSRSVVSVERISQLLGLVEPPSASDSDPSPLASTSIPSRVGASTRPGNGPERIPSMSPQSRAATREAGRGSVARAAGAITTSKAVSGDAPLVPAGVPSGNRGLVTALTAGALLVLGIGAVAIWSMGSHQKTSEPSAMHSDPSTSSPTVTGAPARSEAPAPEAVPLGSHEEVADASSVESGVAPPEAKLSSMDEKVPKAGAPRGHAPFAAPSSHPAPPAPALSVAPGSTAPEPLSLDPSATVGQAFLNINSIPVSSVILDGMPIGSTPKLKFPGSPGPHLVLFLNPEQGFKKQITVTVGAGETKAAIGAAN
jgi:eukaryotic-like serine/threonine-protein kinase